MLHDDKIAFVKLITATARELKIPEDIVEKDYYVTAFLESIVKRNPDIVFKGGTSLAKCHRIINRFSEDIDLSLRGDSKPTEGQRKALKRDIVAAVDELGLSLDNSDETRSRRDFNQYIVSYPNEFTTENVKQKIIAETAVFFRIYPTDKKKANSYIYDYLSQNNRGDLIEKFGLRSFEVEVQSLERTLIDKCFALADYYYAQKIETHSRHIYDIYKLMERINPDDSLKSLAELVRLERQSNKTCLSASDSVDLNKVLEEILKTEVYKNDYNNVTEAILFKGENVSYFEAVKGLQKVIQSGIFSRDTQSIENCVKRPKKTPKYDLDR